MKKPSVQMVVSILCLFILFMTGCGTNASSEKPAYTGVSVTSGQTGAPDKPRTTSVVKTPAASPAAVSGRFFGLNYSPYIEKGQSPEGDTVLSDSQIRATLAGIAPYTQWIRTYGCTGNLAAVGATAHELRLKVAAGAWLSADREANDKEINSLIALASRGEADLLIVGSETLLRGDLAASELLEYIQTVKESTHNLPVTTAEPAAVLLAHPEVITAVDCVFANIYPYWDGIDVAGAIGSVNRQYSQLAAQAAGKCVVVSETGWPDSGNTVQDAVPTPEAAARYLADFCSWANRNNAPYFLFEAYDEPWKGTASVPQEAHWGLLAKDGLKEQAIEALDSAGAYTGATLDIDLSRVRAIAATPAPTPPPDLPDLSVKDIKIRFGAYGGMGISAFKNCETFTMTLEGGSWASIGIDVSSGEGTVDLSGYRYAVIRAKGEKGGEQFRFGLGIGPTDFYVRQGLSNKWEDIVIDISKSSRDLTQINQVGFEIGPSWTENSTNTTIMVAGIRFTNTLPKDSYVLVDAEA